MKRWSLLLFLLFFSQEKDFRHPKEARFTWVKRLTYKGQNGEAYFSFDGKKVVFQSTRGKDRCDQIYVMELSTQRIRKVSPGGRNTCAFFLKDGKLIFSSTYHKSLRCPPPPPRKYGYVWPLYKDYDIFLASPQGKILKRLTKNPDYDAEATVSPDGQWIVFTSLRQGDLDLYLMKIDGTGLRRLTFDKGYDGGAFFSPDGQWIVYRAYHPKTKEEIEEYEFLLKQNLVKPKWLELFVIRPDGTGKRQITFNGKVNFAPYFFPNGKRIIFTSNLFGRHSYELCAIDLDGKNFERITYTGGFNGFPMFSPNGQFLLFISNRGKRKNPRSFDIFLAKWR